MLAALALHAVSMGRANLGELLWACHIASTCLALGILLGSRTAVATGFIFHLAIGFPAWLIALVSSRGTFGGPAVIWHLVATSILVHLLPIALGAICLGFPREPLPRSSILFAWLLQVAMILPARWFTSPDLNVNFAHGVWPPLMGIFSRLWVFQIAFCLTTLASLLLVSSIFHWRFCIFRTASAEPASTPTEPAARLLD